MSCVAGFDPFGERDAAFFAHAHNCGECARVLSVLEAGARVWKEEATSDAARAVFRERRLARTRALRPARAAVLSAVVFLVLGAATAWAFERIAARWNAPAVASQDGAVTRAAPPATTTAVATPPEEPSSKVSAPPEEPLVAAPSATDRVPAVVPPAASTPRPGVAASPTPLELWERGVVRLDEGDRTGAAALFRRVIDAPNVDLHLQRRAMFRWSQVVLATGDSVAPRATLWQLVRGPDATIGFDAALLLERCAPDDRPRIWDTYLAGAPPEALRAEAIARRNAALR